MYLSHLFLVAFLLAVLPLAAKWQQIFSSHQSGNSHMKKFLLALSMLPALTAVAAPIPEQVEKTLKTYQYDNYVLRNGVLSLTLRKSTVNKDSAYFFFSGICNTIFVHPWDEKLITSMRILNSTQDQGFEFSGGGKECKQAGALGFDESKKFIESRTSEL
ncbi:hypothetical protein [Pantoea sp. Z09]|uniref:hypothetical protein n=2 Tax=Pantoea TaxID=53335 RepID=UPI001EFD9913|nr:hypothetical protein [Pantoea sp. Z09]